VFVTGNESLRDKESAVGFFSYTCACDDETMHNVIQSNMIMNRFVRCLYIPANEFIFKSLYKETKSH
ncbi:MAG TPA: hypothetical protein DCE74_10455, partial [Porphyromonadaceae bacterium]|nr:hypothetical protein [Porphyromonadaceae bacterium]